MKNFKKFKMQVFIILGIVSILIALENHAYAVPLTYDSAQWDTGQRIAEVTRASDGFVFSNNGAAASTTSAASLPIGGTNSLFSLGAVTLGQSLANDGELLTRAHAQINSGSLASLAEAAGSASFMGTVNTASFNTLAVDLTGSRQVGDPLTFTLQTRQTQGNVLFTIDDITAGTNL